MLPFRTCPRAKFSVAARHGFYPIGAHFIEGTFWIESSGVPALHRKDSRVKRLKLWHDFPSSSPSIHASPCRTVGPMQGGARSVSIEGMRGRWFVVGVVVEGLNRVVEATSVETATGKCRNLGSFFFQFAKMAIFWTLGPRRVYLSQSNHAFSAREQLLGKTM